MCPTVPEKPSLDGLEPKWMARWEEEGTYRFDRTRTRAEIYSVDTPPPTVSGTLHVGSAFSYTHTDLVVRFQRMRGREVYYPMGWDDNGLPTERRVQNFFGVACDPSLPYDPDFRPPQRPGRNPVPVSRPNFVELCHRLTAEDERAFEALWRRLGLSVDWSWTYATIDERSQRASQRAFLRNLARGEAYQAEAPTLWDVDYRTAVAQAEMEDRELPGAYHRVRFDRAQGDGHVEIETTRPELIPACVALVAHPDDARFRPLFGTEVLTPLFRARVPVVAHELADPEKGSGIAMICTFGDVTDVTWWRELGLPIRAVVQRDGRLRPVSWGEPGWESDAPDQAQRAYEALAGLTVEQARERMAELLREGGQLQGEPRPITHPVKFYERGEHPLEIVTSRQWYIRNGGRDPELRDELLRLGKELAWHPDFMRVRYEDWVSGLNGDWLVSRQRFFGVPFPVWYPILDDGAVDHDHPLVPPQDRLPVDPSTDVPDGYTADQRDRPGGFTGDPDVMDTWATSSMTPQIASWWEEDDDLFGRLFPMDLRPQGHDIIRTWLFVTVLRSYLEQGGLPWTNAAVSGFIYDPDRKKMSKSKGNVVTPMELLEQFGSDGFRYWAASGRPGMDSTFDTGQMRIGRRLAIKILNASRFVLSRLGSDGSVTAALDAAMLARLAAVVSEATSAFDAYDYARALERTEEFFWSFCDDYLELVKSRAYGSSGEEGAASANRALTLALSTLLRAFAPFLPFVTEEVWSWWPEAGTGSIHRGPWPDPALLLEAAGADADPAVLEAAAAVLARVRKAKTEARRSMRAPVARLSVRGSQATIAALERARADLVEAGNLAELVLEAVAGDSPQAPEVSVELADEADGD
ncbi:MAG: valine--tRNA ligase [Actinobacteria bacterium]|nr:MAG: valine--tRNA ligase [Actinomycetota bacterium]